MVLQILTYITKKSTSFVDILRRLICINIYVFGNTLGIWPHIPHVCTDLNEKSTVDKVGGCPPRSKIAFPVPSNPFSLAVGLLNSSVSIIDPWILWPSSISDQAPCRSQHSILQQRSRAPVLANVCGCYSSRHCRKPVADLCQLLHHSPIRWARLFPQSHRHAHLGQI